MSTLVRQHQRQPPASGEAVFAAYSLYKSPDNVGAGKVHVASVAKTGGTSYSVAVEAQDKGSSAFWLLFTTCAPSCTAPSCQCFYCGSTTNPITGGGKCGKRIAGCSPTAGTSANGCYSSHATLGCDCATGKVLGWRAPELDMLSADIVDKAVPAVSVQQLTFTDTAPPGKRDLADLGRNCSRPRHNPLRNVDLLDMNLHCPHPFPHQQM